MMKGYNNIISNIAQIILIVILLPFLAILCSVVLGKDAPATFVDFLVSLIGQIPVCDIWVDILYQSSSGLTQSDFIEAIPIALLRSVPETLLLTVSVHASNQFFRSILKQRGLPIFSTMLGIVLSTIITSAARISESLIMELGVIVITSIGIMLALKAAFGIRGHSIFGAKRVILIIMDALLAVIACAYVSVLILAAAGHYSSPGKAIGSIVIVTGCVILAAILRYIASFGEDDDV